MYIKKVITLSFLASVLALVKIDSVAVHTSLPVPVTFNNQVVRILQQRCQVCHHDGDIAPFSLVTYNEAKLFAEVIHEATESREMPPWKASSRCEELSGERSLRDEEIEILA